MTRATAAERSAVALHATGKAGLDTTLIWAGAKSTPGAPTTGAHVLNEVILDSAHVFWRCTTAGTPGTWVAAGGGSQTPWTQNIDADGYELNDVKHLTIRQIDGFNRSEHAVTSSAPSTGTSQITVATLAEQDDGDSVANATLWSIMEESPDANGFSVISANADSMGGMSAEAALVAAVDDGPDTAYSQLSLGNFDAFARQDEPDTVVVETGYLTGPIPRRAVTASATLVLNDAGKTIDANHATVAIVLTVPANASVAFRVGSRVYVRRTGAAAVTFTPSGGVTIRNNTGVLASQYSTGYLEKVGTDEWDWVSLSAGVTQAYVDAEILSLSEDFAEALGEVQAQIDLRPLVTSVTSSATPTYNTDNTDVLRITALAVAITSMVTNKTGNPQDQQRLEVEFKDNGTARAITWGADFEAKGVPLPTTTVANKRTRVGLTYDTTTAKWGCIAAITEA